MSHIFHLSRFQSYSRQAKEALVYSIENAPTDVGVANQADYYQPLTLSIS
jgi:hypothetical protein